LSLRILIANYEFPPVGGGASKVSYELAKKLVAKGHEVIVLTSRFGDLSRVEKRDGIVIHRVSSWRKGIHDSGLRGAFTYLFAALPVLRRILKTERVDVVHYFFGLPTGLLSLYSHGITRKPYIISLRGSDVPLYDRDSSKLMLLHGITRSLSHRIWRGASSVFAVSHGLRELAEESFPDVSVEVIHNGVDVIDGKSAIAGAREGSPLKLLCVSRLIPRKGISDLLEALARSEDLDYVLKVAGEGPSDAALVRLAAELGIADRVQFIGYKSAQELNHYYVEADAFVLPTRSDAFANVILEAMAAGLPVIATRVGGVGEAVLDGETGILVEPRRPDQLATAIALLANDRDLARRYGLAGQARVRRHFTWSEIADRYVEAYSQACEPSAESVLDAT
jgi:glycosyltransferase involved in cell wall biosynthesis